MPQVVVCNACRQQFMAEDYLRGQIVPCPACGASLAIATPPPSPLMPPAQARAHFSPAGEPDVMIGLGIVGAAAVLWLLAVLPILALWAAGRPAAGLEKVGAGAAVFWIGVLAACGGICQWSFFMDSYKMRVVRDWFGDRGARWFYTGVGGVVALMGLGVTLSATAYSLFGTSITSPERPHFAAHNPHRQPLTGPQVSSPPPPPAARPAADADNTSPPMPPAPASGPSPEAPPAQRNEFSELPGQWRQLVGGYCVKVPASADIREDKLDTSTRQTQQHIRAVKAEGKPEGVTFSVHATLDLGRPDLDSKALFGLAKNQAPAGESEAELIVVNGLTLMKTISHPTGPSAFGRKTLTLHKTTYRFAEKKSTVTLAVYSQLPLDHADQQALAAYLNTFQRMPEPLAAESGAAAADTAIAGNNTGAWQLLEGGFRIRTSPALAIRLNEVQRRGSDEKETLHLWHGQTADDVTFKVEVNFVPTWNHTNEARKIAAQRSARPSPNYEHVAVDVNGLVMERITRLPPEGHRGIAIVEYKYREGQHEINMSARSRLPLDHASFQTVIRCLESLERVPAP